jgi:hypothetical protein
VYWIIDTFVELSVRDTANAESDMAGKIVYPFVIFFRFQSST